MEFLWIVKYSCTILRHDRTLIITWDILLEVTLQAAAKNNFINENFSDMGNKACYASLDSFFVSMLLRIRYVRRRNI